MELSCPATALSPSVQRLICRAGVTESRDGESASSDGLLSLERIAKLLPTAENTVTYFEDAVEALSPVFTQSEHVVDRTMVGQLLSVLRPHLLWTNCPELFTECIEMLKQKENSPSHGILILLLVSAALERALGNVYLLHGVRCPSMLKDLLVTQELTDILGSTVMETLRVVIGPPISLNLRNVAWHGFLADGELPRRYCCFLVKLTASIGRNLMESGIAISSIPHRPQVMWTEPVTPSLITQDSTFTEETLKSVLQCLVSSSVAQPQTVEQWRLAFECYKEGRYGFGLALILPLLEHCLRRLFATLNCCPERVLTAESSAFYTTYNEMLEQSLPDGSINQLPLFLGSSCMDLLLDLLFYPDGPRVRDHLSHGEMDFRSVSQSLVDPFISVAVFLADKVNTHITKKTCIEKDPELNDMVQKVKAYRSQFHPIALLQKKLAEFLTSLADTDGCILLSPELEVLGERPQMINSFGINPLLVKAQEAVTTVWKCDQWNSFGLPITDTLLSLQKQVDVLQQQVHQPVPTLFRWQLDANSASSGVMKENEFVGLLLRVTEECSTVVKQVHQALQLRQRQLLAKELRSRQRENLKKLLLCVPCLQLLLFAVAVRLTQDHQLLNMFSSLGPEPCRLLQRHLKAVLQHCENVRTYTSAEKNKWTEAVDLMLSLMTKIQQFVTQWTNISSSSS